MADTSEDTSGGGLARSTVSALSAANTSATAVSSGSGTVFQPDIRTTGPTTLYRHLLSDEQLDMFAIEKREGLAEAFWAFVAGALGALPSSGEALYNAYVADPPTHLTPLHLFEIMSVVVCAFLAGTIKFIWKGRTKRIEALVNEIKSRPAQ